MENPSSTSKRRPSELPELGSEYPFVLECVRQTMPGRSASGFQTTSWSLVIAAADAPTTDSTQALSRLCDVYWGPVYAFIRRTGHDPDEAQDLTQGFFALLIEKNYLRAADRQRGRFRSFLLTAVKGFLANEWDRANALKRGGGTISVSIDSSEAEIWYRPSAVKQATPETLFQQRWALSLLERVMAIMQTEYAANGKDEQFEKLSAFLKGKGTDARYEDLAAQMGVSAAALRMSLMRMRRRYRELLRAEIAATVARAEDIDDEIRFLLSSLRTGNE